MDRSDLIELVKRNTLNVKEIELFTAINKWAANQCKKLGLDTVERRQILGDDIIDNLRFPVMEENEFNVVKSTNLLTKEETQEVLNNFADSRWPIRFLRHKRQYDPSSQRRTIMHEETIGVGNLTSAWISPCLQRAKQEIIRFVSNPRVPFSPFAIK